MEETTTDFPQVGGAATIHDGFVFRIRLVGGEDILCGLVAAEDVAAGDVLYDGDLFRPVEPGADGWLDAPFIDPGQLWGGPNGDLTNNFRCQLTTLDFAQSQANGTL